MRTANLVASNPARPLAHLYNAADGHLGGDLSKAIGTIAPGNAGGPPLSGDDAKSYAHGEIKEGCIATILVDTECSLKCYFFNRTWKRWVWAGATELDSTKALEADGQWSFYGQEGTLFYLVSDVVVDNALVHG